MTLPGLLEPQSEPQPLPRLLRLVSPKAGLLRLQLQVTGQDEWGQEITQEQEQALQVHSPEARLPLPEEVNLQFSFTLIGFSPGAEFGPQITLFGR
jgi:hypothetical protein